MCCVNLELKLGFGHKNLDHVHVVMNESLNRQLMIIWLCMMKNLNELRLGICVWVSCLG